jgi:hypothetical protein
VDKVGDKTLKQIEKTRQAVTLGRGALLALIEELVESAANGTSSVVFLAGEPGIGKTWLLDRASDNCSVRGATVLCGGAVDAEGMPPYLVSLEALGAHIHWTSADALRVQAGNWARIFVAEELLRAWIETGVLIRRGKDWRLTRLPHRLLSPGLRP